MFKCEAYNMFSIIKSTIQKCISAIAYNMIALFLIICFVDTNVAAQEVKIIHFEDLQKMSHPHDDTTYIINFFASWCVPCVKEMPILLDFEKSHSNQKIKLIFVSIDFKSNYKETLLPLLQKLNIKKNIFLLQESNESKWIQMIDAQWSGDLPATLIVNAKKKQCNFYHQSIDTSILEKQFNQ